jgi:DNA-binding NtrC family response regulator
VDRLWRRAPRVDQLLRSWLAAHAGILSPRDLVQELVATGAAGIRRWTPGGHVMQLLHAIPSLLQLVHEADDERTALEGCCRWAREQAGAEAAALIASDGRIVASTGVMDEQVLRDRRSGLEPAGADVAQAPVRYGGTSIGVTIVKMTPGRAAIAQEAADAIAALCAGALRARLDAIAQTSDSHRLVPEILGRSPAIRVIRDHVVRAASAPFAVLIEGESGTGKELVARAIHRLGPRRDRSFCAINCAAVADDLFEAELFGHTRGAFTGAVGARIGLLESAQGGTLFLDEVSELSPRAQAKLLRVLQERELRRIGENVSRRIDIRVVAASNRPLTAAVREGRFREDLLFRLAVIRIRLPPLRERVEDIPIIAQACWRDAAPAAGKRALLAPDALAALCRGAWPGNVRQLQNTMAALALVAPVRGRVTARQVAEARVDPDDPIATDSRSLDRVRRDSEQRAIAAALARHGGRRMAAARELGITRQGLAKAIKRLGLPRDSDSIGVA